jgi:hypothetical protein
MARCGVCGRVTQPGDLGTLVPESANSRAMLMASWRCVSRARCLPCPGIGQRAGPRAGMSLRSSCAASRPPFGNAVADSARKGRSQLAAMMTSLPPRPGCPLDERRRQPDGTWL